MLGTPAKCGGYTKNCSTVRFLLLLRDFRRRSAPLARRCGRRLVALGYTDPENALHHLEALTSGVSRRAAIQRTLLPVMLGWFADAPDPDAGLLAFRQVSDSLGDTHWYLRLLRDEGAAAQHLARCWPSSRYAADLFMRAPESVAMLADAGDGPHSCDRGRLADSRRAAGRRAPPRRRREAAIAAAGLRRRELLRIACADLLGLLDVDAGWRGAV